MKSPRGFLLLTAMPLTTGHIDLMNFAREFLGDSKKLTVILCTQPDEPLVEVRVNAVRENLPKNSELVHIHKTVPQNPSESIDFWPMWKKFLEDAGFEKGDLVFASEAYGFKLAETVDGEFIPYDLGRELNPAKAVFIREGFYDNWKNLSVPFQKLFQKRIVFFGNESIGKTTTSRRVAVLLNEPWLFEYARPYLEQVGADLNRKVMENIWHGQRAIQGKEQSSRMIIQDTDLFSTVGYWRLHDEVYGKLPEDLIVDAQATQGDLYVILKSNIPFEEDPLRYGGTVRETSDDYWIDICREFDLNYVIIEPSGFEDRVDDSMKIIKEFFESDPNLLALSKYVRR